MKGPMHKNSQDRIDKIEALLPKQKPKSFTDELGEASRPIHNKSLVKLVNSLSHFQDTVQKCSSASTNTFVAEYDISRFKKYTRMLNKDIELIEELMDYQDPLEELEAKLKIAVEALTWISKEGCFDKPDNDIYCPGSSDCDCPGQKADETLEKLND